MNRFQRHIIARQIVALRVLTFALVLKRLIEMLPLEDNDEDYNNADQLVSENGVTYSYDLNGNLVTKNDSTGVTGYTYDYDNRLTSVSSPSGSISYKYDADGNRVEQNTSSGTVRYLVDTNRSLAQVLAEYTPSGAVIASYVYADDLISMARGGQLYFYHFDGLGSTRLLTDGGGNVTDTYSYDAFGNLIARTGTTENPFLFTGQQYDANTGFYYLRARYYQPSNGRFTAYDPFEGDPYAPMTLHRYLYASANPVNRVDLNGKQDTLVDLMVSIAIVGILASISYSVSSHLLSINRSPVEWEGGLMYGGGGTGGWGVLGMTAYLKSKCTQGKRGEGIYLLAVAGLMELPPILKKLPALPSEAVADVALTTPGIWGTRPTALVGPVTWISATGGWGFNASYTCMYMGTGIGKMSIKPGWVFGIDIGLDIMGGFSIPLFMKESACN